MSKFNEYARKLNDIATEAFSEYGKATENLKRAKLKVKSYPFKSITDAEYELKRAKANAELMEAEKDMKAARLDKYLDNIKAVRKELETAVDLESSAKPEQIDPSAMELLKSGIMNPREMDDLLAKMTKDGNFTMVRLIGKYAAEAAKSVLSEKGDAGVTLSKDYQAVAYTADNTGLDNLLTGFDFLSDTFYRCTQNPTMIPHWNELTGSIIDRF
ncbi:MAG: hypothetical protein IJ526_12760 [Lachnospiraceae bacterium]|nr:hypothetical protein [Lachnospiraceae bacterium]